MKVIIAITIVSLFLFCGYAGAQNFDIVTSKSKASIFYDTECELDSIAGNLLADDIERITGYRPLVSPDIRSGKGNVIVIGSINSKIVSEFRGKTNLDNLKGKW